MKNIFLAFLQSETNFVSWEFKDDLKLLSNTLRVNAHFQYLSQVELIVLLQDVLVVYYEK